MPPKERKIEINPLVVGGILVVVATVILLIMSFSGVFHKNPYGPETRIDNIDLVDKKLPQERKDQIFAQLYRILAENMQDGEPPKSGALVREGTIDYSYDKETKIYAGDFIVDVPSVEQSYRVQISWSPDKKVSLGGYPILIMCAPNSLRIYTSQVGCINPLAQELAWNNAYQLDYTFGAMTSQKIRTVLGRLVIVDDDSVEEYTATVDETSLKKLREQPDLTYQYDIIFGGERYRMITRVDGTYGRDYIAIYVDAPNKQQGIIITDKEEQVGGLSAWLKELSGVADLEITAEKLNF